MKNNKFFHILILLIPFSVTAQDAINVYSNGSVAFKEKLVNIARIQSKDMVTSFILTEGEPFEILVSDIDSMTFSTYVPDYDDDNIYINFQDGTVSITNPLDGKGVSVVVANQNVTVNSTVNIADLKYHISGTTSDGSVEINSKLSVVVLLNEADITSLSLPPINLSGTADAVVNLAGKNRVTDHSNNSKNACFILKGNTLMQGDGTLLINANKKNGLSSSKLLTITEAEITVPSAVDDAKAIKSDDSIIINGGKLKLTVSGDQSKAMDAKKDIQILAGDITILASGKTVLKASKNGYDTSYCSGIKADGSITIAGGNIAITLPSSNNGGKGISSDTDILITGGAINITTAGNGSAYTNANRAIDSYSSACIKANRNITITDGTINCSSSGSGGKGISADSTLVIGSSSTSPSVTVYTSGERFYVSGSGENVDYSNPKAIKSTKDLTIHSGTIRIACTQSNGGSEGLESNNVLTINGGNISIETKDDCINASKHIEITGGTIYCVSSGNDAIDSNGTLSISGGLILAHGAGSPECGLDCDDNRFAITGGTIIGTGGTNSTPTGSACTQYIIDYSNATSNSAICLKDFSGEPVLMFKLPAFSSSSSGEGGDWGGNSGSGMKVLISTPKLKTGTYTLHYGGTINATEQFNGYITKGAYSGGSTKTVTIHSIVTSIQ